MKQTEYPRILIVSDAVWADDNNIGNTLTNLLEDWPKEKLAMVYARPHLPDTVACDNFFQISETRLFKNLFNPRVQTGQTIDTAETKQSKTLQSEEQTGKQLYQFFVRYRWNMFILARELLWKLGRWQTEELNHFIDDFKPDIVFALASPGTYMNRIQQYIISYAQTPSAVYFVDDIYTLEESAWSPLYRLERRLLRDSMNETVRQSDLIYTIIPKQQAEYAAYLERPTKILNKGGEFEQAELRTHTLNQPLKLVYTGNIYAGRWDTLETIGRALDQINQAETKALLYIYTRNPLSDQMKQAVAEIQSLQFMGGIPAHEVAAVQSDADILLHVESFDKIEKNITRLSFSTKIVDYFQQGKCILAVGWEEAASIEYLIQNDTAVVITDLSETRQTLEQLLNQPELIQSYGEKAWQFGKENHEIHQIKEQFRQEMAALTQLSDER